jgi:hypothetical protein
VHAATRRLAEQTTNALDTRALAARLDTRYSNVDLRQRAGHMFELMHAHGFNRDAIKQGSRLRARVTNWNGAPAAAADLHIVDGARVVAEGQAKLREKVTDAAFDQARSRYEGMQRIVAADQLDDLNGLLDKRLAGNPEGLYFEAYQDVRAHSTDRLHRDGVASDPIARSEALDAAQSPTSWGNRQAARAVTKQVGAAVAAGAAGGALTAGVCAAAAEAARVREGETTISGAAWSAAGAAARGAAREGALAGLAEAVKVAAAAGRMPTALGAGTLPAAVADAVAAVSAAGLAFARGEIDSGELAARSCESTLQTGLMWACGTIGQSVIPVPVVGAMVGGLVGQWSATVIAQGLRSATEAARADALDEQCIALLEAETLDAVAAAARLSGAETELGGERNAYVTATVVPLLDDALLAIAEGSGNAVELLADLATAFAGQPLFCTVDEFDAWMSDDDLALVLDPNMN